MLLALLFLIPLVLFGLGLIAVSQSRNANPYLVYGFVGCLLAVIAFVIIRQV